MADNKPGPRPVKPPPPRYARGWCPRCRWFLEVQYLKPPMPNVLICHGCHRQASTLSAGYCPLKGSHPATAVWGPR